MKPGTRSKPDPLHKAKRKHLLATEVINTGAHPLIKKNIGWAAIVPGGGEGGSRNGSMRMSTSQTPGISDKSYTPTPAARNGGIRKISGGSVGGSQMVKKEVTIVSPPKGGSAGGSGSQPAPRMPPKSTPASKRAQSLPEIIDLDSEVDDEADYRPPTNTTTTTTTSGRLGTADEEPSATSTPNPARGRKESTPPLSSPEREVPREANGHGARSLSQPLSSPELGEASLDPELPLAEEAEDDYIVGDRPTPPPPTPPIPSRPTKTPSQTHLNGSSKTSTQTPAHTGSTPPSSSPSPPTRRTQTQAQTATQVRSKKRRRSSVGIQTLPDNEVDWIADLDVDATMSAVDVSRVWLGSSPVRRGSGVGPDEVEVEEDEEEEEEAEGGVDERVLGGLEDEGEGEGEGEGEDVNEEQMAEGEEREEEREERGVSVNPFDVGRLEDMGDRLPMEQPAEVEPDQEPESAESEEEDRPEDEEHVSPSPSPVTARRQLNLPTATVEEELAEPDEPAPEPPGTFPLDASSSRRSSSTAAGPFGADLSARVTALRASVSQLGGSHVKPFPFMLRSQEGVATDVARSAAEAALKASAANTNTNGTQSLAPASRSDSRRSTPLPATRSKPLAQELRAAPTLGRSLLGDANPAPGAKKPDTAAKAAVATSMDISPHALRAAPTLGRSMDAAASEWEAARAGKGKAVDVEAEVKVDKGKAVELVPPGGTDYDAEYGSIRDIPSSLPSGRPSQSMEPGVINMSGSPNGTWRLEPTQASSPQPFRTQIPEPFDAFEAGHALFREQEPPESSKPRPRRQGLLRSPTQPTSIATLKRRRRTSGAGQSFSQPLPSSKKIRREYDMPESIAVPRDTRAHEDTYDDDGHRTWIPARPEMQRAPEGVGVRRVVGPKYLRPSGEESEEEAGEEVVETAALGGGQQELEWEPEPAPGPAPEPEAERHEVDETAGQPEADLTEVAETPQVAPVEFEDLHGYGSSIANLALEQPMPAPGTPEHVSEPPVLAVEPPSSVIEHPASIAHPSSPVAGPSGSVLRSREQSGEPPLIRFSTSKRARSKRSSFKPERASFAITPARQTVWSPPRTRLSLGGRSGPSVVQVSESDQAILQQAGLKPTLRRLSHAHGFTTEVVADVYQEQGSLKETEEMLKEMNRSANAARAKLVRRKSLKGTGFDVSHSRERDLESTGDEEDAEEGESGIRQWDTTRTGREILFGPRV